MDFLSRIFWGVENELFCINTHGTRISKGKEVPNLHQSYQALTGGNYFLTEGSTSQPCRQAQGFMSVGGTKEFQTPHQVPAKIRFYLEMCTKCSTAMDFLCKQIVLLLILFTKHVLHQIPLVFLFAVNFFI